MKKIAVWVGFSFVGMVLLWALLPIIVPVKVPKDPRLKGITLELKEGKISSTWMSFLLNNKLIKQKGWNKIMKNLKRPLAPSKVASVKARLNKEKLAFEAFEKAAKSHGCSPITVLPKYDKHKKAWLLVNWLRVSQLQRIKLHTLLAEGKASDAAVLLASWLRTYARIEAKCPKAMESEMVLLGTIERMIRESASVFGAPGLSKEAQTALLDALRQVSALKFGSMVEALRVDFSYHHRRIYEGIRRDSAREHFLGRMYKVLFWDQKRSEEITREFYRLTLWTLKHGFFEKSRHSLEMKKPFAFDAFLKQYVASHFRWGSRFRDTNIDSILLGISIPSYVRFCHRWRMVRCQARAHLARAMKRLSISGKKPMNSLTKKRFTGGDVVDCGDFSGKSKKTTLVPWAPYQKKP